MSRSTSSSDTLALAQLDGGFFRAALLFWVGGREAYGAGMRATAKGVRLCGNSRPRAGLIDCTSAAPLSWHDAVLASDEEARQLAMLMLDEQADYPCAEIWDGARLVCTLRRGE